MKVLVIDVGGNHVKILATAQRTPRKFPSGIKLTPRQMVAGVKQLAGTWKYDAVSIGYPGPVLYNRPMAEPHNLGKGWVGFDFQAAFNRPAKLINDAAMQALGSYKKGKMLFLGLGTGLGSALIVEGHLAPMELGHLPYRKGTYEGYVGQAALNRYGKKKWQRNVKDVVALLVAALLPDDVVLGGGNAKKLKQLPPACRAGNNSNAFRGGFRLWEDPHPRVRLRTNSFSAGQKRLSNNGKGAPRENKPGKRRPSKGNTENRLMLKGIGAQSVRPRSQMPIAGGPNE